VGNLPYGLILAKLYPASAKTFGGHMESGQFLRKGIALIDDDKDFGRLMCHIAQSSNLPIDFYESLDQLGSVGLLGQYDVIILDYYLEKMNGIEIAQYIDTFFPGVPAILTSAEAFIPMDKDVPHCVHSFISKACGPVSILSAAMLAVSKKRKPTAN
jgi:CheY-like chemotaxis protein